MLTFKLRTMNKTALYFLFFLLLLSCDKRLDLEPSFALTPETVLENGENLQSLLIGAYSFMRDELQGELQVASELLANEGNLLFLGTFDTFAQFDAKAMTTTNVDVLLYWDNLYRAINLCNVVLDNLEIEQDPELRMLLEGEARFLRGLCYFELTLYYGLPYEAGGSNSQPGVPVVLTGVTGASQISFPERASVEAVYQQAVEDLETAYEMLPTDNFELADAYAAQAILARLYLQQGDYNAARDAANDVLENSGHALAPDYASAFNNESDGIEGIFMWQITTQDGDNLFNEYWATLDLGGRSPTADISILPPFFDVFDGFDDRSFFFYEGNGTTVSSKWINQFANVPYIRVAEMHLIRAECNFRLGTSLGLAPETEINALRARSNAAPLSGLSLQDIIDERKRELSFEGFALHDVRRLQQSVAGLPYNDNSLVMPIPQTEMDANPNLQQNPGYSN